MFVVGSNCAHKRCPQYDLCQATNTNYRDVAFIGPKNAVAKKLKMACEQIIAKGVLGKTTTATAGMLVQ